MKLPIAISLLALLLAPPTEAEPMPLWKAATYSGSERLTLFSLLKTKPAGFRPYAKKLMLRDGIYHEEGSAPQAVFSTLRIRPLLGYDRNLNSGIPVDEFVLGDFLFRTDEKDRAKAGITVGGKVSGAKHYSVAPGHVVKFAGMASYEISPEHNLSKSALYGSACLNSHVKSYTWIDSCAGARATKRENSGVEEAFFSVGGSKVVGSSIGHHEVNWSIKRTSRSEFSKSYLNFGIRSAVEDLGAINANLTVGQRVDGFNTVLYGLTMSFHRPIFERDTSFFAGYYKLGGGTHFGLPREDENYTVKVASQLHENISVGLGYVWNESDIDMYKSENVILDLNFTSWKF